jgi:hypothetical protein
MLPHLGFGSGFEQQVGTWGLCQRRTAAARLPQRWRDCRRQACRRSGCCGGALIAIACQAAAQRLDMGREADPQVRAGGLLFDGRSFQGSGFGCARSKSIPRLVAKDAEKA